MSKNERLLLNGNEAVAHAAYDVGIELARGYPGTPSTEILETLSALGGQADWSPNEKVALEVALGAAFANAKAMATMKHVGLNVAADPLFTGTHTGVTGALVIVVADDPGMASSQNEQDSRRYAVAAGCPMVEPADSQEAYDFFIAALELSHRWQTPVLFRMTTRVNHSKSIVQTRTPNVSFGATQFTHDRPALVMVPANARPAHRRMRQRLADVAEWGETCALNTTTGSDAELGIIASGAAALHAIEAAPEARMLKLGLTYPPPMNAIREFAASVKRCVVIEEGDPVLVDTCLAAGIAVEGKDEIFRFGELDVERVRRILSGDSSQEFVPPKGKPPQLCPGCPHRTAFDFLNRHDCIVSGDIGCYTLGVLPPFQAIDTCVCMGASVGVGLGLRHVLPPDQAKRVVSVIGDSTFVHSGITGLVEMAYNPPPTGHVLLILDNSTTAMTGLQEHPGTGRSLNREPATQVKFEDLARTLGIPRVHIVNPHTQKQELERVLLECLDSGELCVVIARSPCILASKLMRKLEEKERPNG